MITPGSRYNALLEQGVITADIHQHQAVWLFEQLYHQLRQPALSRWQSFVRYIHGTAPQSHNGLYLWGPVGRGKTMLMDLFCQSLPTGIALRLHFHRFMRKVHQQLMDASGQPEPLRFVADSFARQARVLCFDEFYVDNIGDAMLLGRLLEQLFQRGILLVATSNQPPAELYPGGLHRDRFLPTIALLEQQLKLIALNGIDDHRLRYLKPQKNWFKSSEPGFKLPVSGNSEHSIQLCNRTVECLFYNSAQRIAGFDFSQLCTGYRSAMDYIELTEHCDQIWLTGVPAFYAEQREQIKARGTEDGAIANSTGERHVRWSVMDDPARRFISLVDELYDRRVNLIVQAEQPAESLYPVSGALNFQYQRTLSRLTEMGSEQYQQAPPLRDNS
ncbi:MAG: cell division protein ZapE [Marinobacterium sp.]|nr:cell division protein ZapE [Marinobacterium sp.]